jgi:DegV family protein with EDD domain
MAETGFGIVTEEVADLPADLARSLGMELVPVIMVWPELEGIPGDNTFQKMRELERRGIMSFGKTSQPSPEDYAARFRLQLQRFREVVCVCVSSKLSGCFSSAVLARDLLSEADRRRIFVVDSLTATCGQALVVLKAAELAARGKNAASAVVELASFIPRVRMYAMLHDPKWVEAHGRLPHAAASLIRALAKAGVRPVLEIKNGTLAPSGLKVRAQDKAAALFRQVKETVDKAGGPGFKAAVTHGDDESTADRLSSLIRCNLKQVEVVFTGRMNDIIGVPAGPDALAVAVAPR